MDFYGNQMKKLFLFFTMALLCIFSACAQDNALDIQQKESDMKITITIGAKAFTAVLYDNETAQAFNSKMPLTVTMNELNGNEKYYNFPWSFSGGSAQCPGTINTGDIMLWSSNCLVLFYKTFSTSYSYIKIGCIENVAGFAAALGSGNVSVRFEAAQ
jgi:hypothetical protein